QRDATVAGQVRIGVRADADFDAGLVRLAVGVRLLAGLLDVRAGASFDEGALQTARARRVRRLGHGSAVGRAARRLAGARGLAIAQRGQADTVAHPAGVLGATARQAGIDALAAARRAARRRALRWRELVRGGAIARLAPLLQDRVFDRELALDGLAHRRR